MKQSMFSYVFLSFFALASLVGVIVALKIELDRQRVLREYDSVIGTVTDLNFSISTRTKGKSIEVVAPVVTYTTQNGDTLRYSTNFNTGVNSDNAPKIGDKKQVWYNPTNPEKAKLQEENESNIYLFWSLLVNFLIGGIITFGCLALLIRQRQMYKFLTERGQTIQTNFEYTKNGWFWLPEDKTLSSFTHILSSLLFTNKQFIKNKPPQRVVTSWKDPKTQKQYTFLSGYLEYKYDLSIFDKSSSIPVLINPENPKQYWMDLSSFKIKGIVTI
jgi:hypothetical protein